MDVPLIVKPLRPNGPGWEQWPADTSRWPAQPYAIERWYNRAHETQILSSIEIILPEGARESRPEYHISVSGLKHLATKNYRCSDSRARWVLKQIGLDGWFEDNHVPHGLVRNFWRPVGEPHVGEVCPCVNEEPAVREMKGDYVWRGAPPQGEPRG